MRERALTTQERMTWGECSVCHAKDGEPCNADVGVQLGRRVDGRPMETGEGAHVARLQSAPMKVREVPCG